MGDMDTGDDMLVVKVKRTEGVIRTQGVIKTQGVIWTHGAIQWWWK